MEAMDEENIMAIIAMLNTFGKDSNLVCAYTELFGLRPLKTKTHKWRVLLTDVKKLFDGESFAYNKKTYPISRQGIVEALHIVVQRNFTDGLDSHNYLKKIMVGISEREGQNKSRADEKEMKKREDLQRAGYDRPACASNADRPGDAREEITEEQRRRNLTRVGAIIKSIGG